MKYKYNLLFKDGTGELVHMVFPTRDSALLEVVSLILGGNTEVKFYHECDGFSDFL